MNIEHTTLAETRKQGFSLVSPSKPSKRKPPENCFRSYIDQVADGFYSSSKLVRNEPRTTRDIYFVVRNMTTEVRSNRRNKTHRNVALFKTKTGGSKRANIAYLTCSFLELDGTTNGTIKTKGDVFTLIKNFNLPTASYVIETSKGHFHVLWIYNRPLPWTTKNESYWTAQQTRLIQLFQKAGFNVDEPASTNPVQNLRNPSQLLPFNFKRRCEVYIHKSYKKTSLRAIYKALNKTSIPNPRPMKASTKLRRYLRANQTFTLTLFELAITLGVSLRTEKREIKKAVQNGDLRIVARLGNNSEKTRTTQYESLIYIEQFPEVPLVSIKTNSVKETYLLADFQANGAKRGYRNKTVFALGLEIKSQLGKRASTEAIRGELKGGAMRCLVPKKEFERTLKNIMKNSYTHPLSLSKLRAWDLIEETKHFH